MPLDPEEYSAGKLVVGDKLIDDQWAHGCPASDIFRSDMSVVDAAVDELVGGICGQVRDFDFVVNRVVHLAVGTPCLGNLVGGDAAEVCFDSDELSHALCGRCQISD